MFLKFFNPFLEKSTRHLKTEKHLTLLKVDNVDRVALAPYTLATKSTVSATKSTATSC